MSHSIYQASFYTSYVRPIYDEDGPVVSDVFYGYLFSEGKDTLPDPTEAAYALHLAVKKLQADRKVSFQRWIPFIHMGI